MSKQIDGVCVYCKPGEKCLVCRVTESIEKAKESISRLSIELEKMDKVMSEKRRT